MGRPAFFLISAERPSSDYKNYQPLIEGSSSVAIFFLLIFVCAKNDMA